MKKIIFFSLIILFIFSPKINANEDVIEKQTKSLGISDFLNEAKEYSTEIIEDIDISELYKTATQGEVNASFLKNKIQRTCT